MKSEFTSSVINELRNNNGVLTKGDLTIKLAEYFGFCWGVERAVSDFFFKLILFLTKKQIAMAYETRSHFPDRTIHITNEIIHNPQVNERLKEMKIHFLEKDSRGTKNFEQVQKSDVVILPAFGATIEELRDLDQRLDQSRS